MPSVLHFYPLILSLLGIGAIWAGGIWPFALLAWLLAGQAAIEQVMGNRFIARAAPRGDSPVTLAALVLSAPILFAAIAVGLWRLVYTEVAWWDYLGMVGLMGFATGSFGIVAAHELVHRRAPWQRALGVALLLLPHIPHFRIEHVYNHHPNVGTGKDPATARLGESLYHFIPRSVAGQYMSAWRIEIARLRRRGQAAFGPRNRMVQYLVLQAALDAAVVVAFGWTGLLLFLAQGLIGVVLLETVNYLEHYGLARRVDASGRPEPLGPQHSWNAGHGLTNAALYNLGLHGAHHMEAGREYGDLYNDRAFPQLPSGYPGTLLLAFLPPLWRRVMDPRVAAVREKYPGVSTA